MKIIQKSLISAAALLCMSAAYGQSPIVRWNFNSLVPDNMTSTGTKSPYFGVGTLDTIGVNGETYVSGVNIDTAPDNSGLNTNGYPAASANNKTAGIEILFSTVGFENIELDYYQRSSNTGANSASIFYCLNTAAASPVWTEFDTTFITSGDTWYLNSKNFDAITGLNNNPNAGIRIVSRFATGGSNYVAARSSSTYSSNGTWRFDLVDIKGDSILAPAAQVATIELEEQTVTVNENGTAIMVIATMKDDVDSTVRASLILDTVWSTIAASDIQWPANATFEWAPNSQNVADTILIPIVNDTLSENAEYLVAHVGDLENAEIDDAIFTAFILDDDKKAPVATKADFLKHITSFGNGVMDESSAEIIAYDPASKKIFIANSIAGKIDIVNFANPASPVIIDSIVVYPTYGNINSVAVNNGLVAAAVEALTPQDSGSVVFFDIDGTYLSQVQAGPMPDMITFNHDGTKLFTANEGEPNFDYSVDPEGSVSIINVPADVRTITANDVKFITFNSYNGMEDSLNAIGIRIYGPGASVAQDLEPEYVTISPDNNTAYVSLQENNAIAQIDLQTETLVGIFPLGTKDHMLSNNALDATDRGDHIALANWPIKGLFMPDAIASFNVGNKNYYITANEGDAREYDDFEEGARLSSGSYDLDTTVYTQAAWLKDQIGRINITKASGDYNQDGYYEEIHVFGGRSFSIFDGETHQLVADNGMDFELITAQSPIFKGIFNASNSNSTFKNRSDDKGPEPEGVATAVINDKVYAFIALERIGGVMVYDVTTPSAPIFVDYKNNRDTAQFGGDLGAEGIIFIDSASSPTNKAYVLVANEVSSTVSVFEVNPPIQPVSTEELDNVAPLAVVFPNPGKESINVVLAGAIQNAQIKILNIEGKVVYQSATRANNNQIDIATLASGLYFIQVENGAQLQTIKFAKQ